jgi:hypothetical protein
MFHYMYGTTDRIFNIKIPDRKPDSDIQANGSHSIELW